MATTNISITAPALIAGIPNPELAVSVPEYGGPVANTPLDVSDVSISVNVNHDFGVELRGLGEESLPEPSLFKYNEDGFIGYDQVRLHVQPNYYDTKTLVDSTKFSTIKGLLNLVPLTERLSFNATKVLMHNGIASDYVSLSTNKVLTDNSTISDSLNTTWNILRTYTDLVQTTDDVLGDANIDDDQYVTFGKGLLDNTTVTDLLYTTWDISRLYVDTSSLSERLEFSFNKQPLDSTSLEEYTSLNLEKPFVNTGAISDILSTEWSILRTYTDTGTTSNKLNFDFYKVILDTTSTTENLEFTSIKALLNTTTAQDSLTTTWNALRSYDDNSSLEDTQELIVDKAPLDSIASIDSVSTIWNILRTYTDLVQLTDDVLGDANIDDDQYVTFGKGLIDSANTLETLATEWVVLRTYEDSTTFDETFSATFSKVAKDDASVSDSLSTNLVKLMTESSVINEYIELNIAKGLVDNCYSTDIVNLSYGKQFTSSSSSYDEVYTTWNINRSILDIGVLSDSLNTSLNKVLSDSIDFLEELSINASSVLIDTMSTSDSISSEWIINRSYQDSFNYNETLTFVNQKTILELVQATDDILGLANIDDDQYVTFGKGEVDSISIAEVVTFLFITGRVFTETTLISEIKTIGKQDYHSSDFVVPYYVGELYIV